MMFHPGGYKLELLDENENFLQSLTTPEIDDQNSPRGWLDNDPTAQRHEVFIPSNLQCNGCTIRLLRQAREWSGGYTFWSCADVDIVNSINSDQDLCMGHGSYSRSSGQCQCDRTFYGSRCQYQNECEDDSDCGRGQCIDVRATTAPTKRCFCEMGYFGAKCDQASSLSSRLERSDLAGYNQRQLNDKADLFWKVVGDEVEVVMKVKGTSYVGVGWLVK